ncbi:rfaE bifunctional protein [Thermodesulfatator indicus DSM 15286]|uniref:D-glycero-beta-D-manno-heptose 1-phosphate adenylyltransferase n=1 Tax=Thermodesulfatator indicus (strain DSM 15286 / JCM 11887 / CIR29812) TaxID=667014 RepID=F8A8R4_THEID|nr:D-glycero-beta-D-manno-heptose 1-phosphate adenylyltransferase [Thermodesulfatator indicus]AEH44894.1 rfaE bifunctional protein [Thermodesulfatator indicus DSM 15286]
MKIGILEYPFYAEPEKTLAGLLELLEKAPEADLVVAPELGISGYEKALEASFLKKAFPTIQKKLKSPLLIGGADISKAKSAAWLITPESITKVAEKINLFPGFDEKKGFKPGRLLPPFTLKGVPIGVFICYDLRFPEIAKKLVAEGAHVLFCLAAWPKARLPHFHTLLRTRAIENQVFCLGVNARGQVEGIELGGQSVAFDPWGKIISESFGGITLLELDFSALEKARQLFVTSRTVSPSLLSEKILPLEELCQRVRRRKALGQKLVFTNGCFDLLHAGHVSYLARAREAGDFLVIGLNSDASVKRIKGPERPINPQENRAKVLAALSVVDYVVFFDEDTPEKLIKTLRPDILVKGADWPEEKIVGASFVKSYGGKVLRIPFEHEISTTKIIEKIRKNEA